MPICHSVCGEVCIRVRIHAVSVVDPESCN